MESIILPRSFSLEFPVKHKNIGALIFSYPFKYQTKHHCEILSNKKKWTSKKKNNLHVFLHLAKDCIGDYIIKSTDVIQILDT